MSFGKILSSSSSDRSRLVAQQVKKPIPLLDKVIENRKGKNRNAGNVHDR